MGLGQLLNSATFKAIGAKGVTLAVSWLYLDVGKVWRKRLPGFGFEEKHVGYFPGSFEITQIIDVLWSKHIFNIRSLTL